MLHAVSNTKLHAPNKVKRKFASAQVKHTTTFTQLLLPSRQVLQVKQVKMPNYACTASKVLDYLLLRHSIFLAPKTSAITHTQLLWAHTPAAATVQTFFLSIFFSPLPPNFPKRNLSLAPRAPYQFLELCSIRP